MLFRSVFTQAHPEVEVIIVGYPGSGGSWQAIIPEEGGETIVARYTLRELLAKLTALLGDR